MRRIILPLLFSTLLVAAVFGLIQVARSQGLILPDGSQVVRNETVGDATRQIAIPAGADTSEVPNIGFIDSPTASCFKPDPTVDECYVNWYYLSVDASPNYMITMTVQLNNAFVATYNGFFQNSMYAPYNMRGNGIKVACGALNSGGNKYLGAAYSYTIRARDSANLSSANYGTVYCPAHP
jgi:hypothetical protein